MEFTEIRLIGLSTVVLPIIGARPSNSYILKAADGLGPPESEVTIASTTEQGGVFLGRRTRNREIVLRVGLNPNYKLGETPASLRETLYGLLTPAATQQVFVRFLNGTSIVAKTGGYVSKIEIVPFSKDPEVQIVIPCPESFLSGPDELIKTAGLKSPFTVSNQGTAPTGFDMEVIFNQNLDSWRIDGPSNWFMKFEYAFKAGDIFSFNTRPGWRSIELVRNRVKSTLIYTLSPGSKWLILRGGDNVFTPSSAAWSWGFVKYTPQYWGI